MRSVRIKFRYAIIFFFSLIIFLDYTAIGYCTTEQEVDKYVAAAQKPNCTVLKDKFNTSDGRVGYNISRKCFQQDWIKNIEAADTGVGPFQGAGCMGYPMSWAYACDNTGRSIGITSSTTVWRRSSSSRVTTYCDGTTRTNVYSLDWSVDCSYITKSPCPQSSSEYSCYSTEFLTQFLLDKCDIKVTKNTGQATIDPSSGGSVDLSASVLDSSGKPISWEIVLPNGKKVAGTGKSPSATWDGKDSQGKFPDLTPGQSTTVIASLSAWHSDDMSCKDTAGWNIKITMNKDCKLEIAFSSTANAASGNLSHSQQLFSTKGAELALSVTLYYNSLDSYRGPLGAGWTHNYDVEIGESSDGYAVLREGDGGRKVYTKSGTSYISQPGDYSVLTKTADNAFVITHKDGIKYIFSQDGKIASIVDRNGNAITFAYTNGNLTAVTDPAGRVAALMYNADNRISAIHDPAGNTHSFSYTGNDLTTVSTSSSQLETRTWTYTYYADSFMYTKTDPNGNTTTYAYDDNHRVASSFDAEKKTKLISYPTGTDTTKTTIFTETDGGEWQYTYDTQAGTLTQKTDPQGGTTRFTYDGDRNMTSRIDPDGSATTFTYDTSGNLTSVTDALDQSTSYTYNSFGQVTAVADAQANTTINAYDEKGNLVSVTDSNGAAITYQYDSKGNVTTVTDAAGQTTIYAYDQNGYLSSITDPTGASTSLAYDINGNITSRTDANGNPMYFEYNSQNQLLKVTDPAGNVTTFAYDKNGNQTSQTDARGNTIRYEYNFQGQVVKVIDALGNVTRYTYGGADCASCSSSGDKLTAVTDANGNTTRYEYDPSGRKRKEIDPLGNETSYTYDPKGNVLTQTDANGRVTSFTYDPLGRIKEQIDPLLGVVKFEYSPKSQVTKVTDPLGNTTIYEYDAAGRITKTSSQDTGTTTYAYNVTGTLAGKIDANGTTIAYTYNSVNKLIRIEYPDASQNITYTYDACTNGKGRICTMTDPSGTTAYGYDKLGRIVNETKTILSVVYSTSYAYDNVGNVTMITYPSGRRVNYGYTSMNRPASVSQLLNRSMMTVASNFAYDKVGNQVSMTYGNGLSQIMTYDRGNRLVTTTSPGTVSANYTYDPVGNIAAINDLLDPAKSKNFTYDPLDRLATALGPWGSFVWTYDANGNRLSQTNGEQHTYVYDANRLQTVSNGHIDYYRYDKNGNTIQGGQMDFVYNQNQRLIKAVQGDKTLAEYWYNGNGQRVIKKTGPAATNSASSQNTVYHYDLSGKLIEETDGNGKMNVDYVYLSGKPLAMITKQSNNERVYYYHNDHLGTPQRMTDGARAIVWSADYKPFGEAMINVSTITNNLRFPGQYYDAETGLSYNYFRDYNSTIGRYIEYDPIGMKGGINLFSYVGNNALYWTDRLGLWRTPHHDRIINRFVDLYFPTLDPMYIQAIEEGSKYADTFQDPEYSYIHHMRNGRTGQSKEDAEALMNNYIDYHLQKSKCYMAQGNYYDAYKYLGMAFHPIMDSTSPTHGDFLPWEGVIPLLLSGMHVAGEATIDDSQIQLTIDRMIKILQ